MEYWIVDCKSTVIVDGVDVSFNFSNTYFDYYKAIEEAKMLSKNGDVLFVSVHKWILHGDGETNHAPWEDKDSIPYHYLNENHRECKKMHDNG